MAMALRERAGAPFDFAAHAATLSMNGHGVPFFPPLALSPSASSGQATRSEVEGYTHRMSLTSNGRAAGMRN